MLFSESGTSLLVWTIIFTIICTLILMLRFWAAHITRRKLAADDYMVLVGYASMIAFSTVNIWTICNGLGAYIGDLTTDQLDVIQQGVVGVSFTWLPATVFFKMSLAWLYTRIFTTKPFIYYAWFAVFLAAAYGVAFVGVFATNCVPIDYNWKHQAGGSCRDFTHGEFTSISFNMIIDLYIILLPMAPLWGLQMAKQNKIFISFMFSIGLVTLAIMAWRLEDTLRQIHEKTDFVHGFCDTLLISSLELWLGLIASCMPTLTPIVTKYVAPILRKVTSRWSTGKNTDKYAMRNVNTIGGGGGPSAQNARRKYGKLGETTDEYDVSDEHLVQIGRSRSRDELEDGQTLDYGKDGIKVKQDVEISYANRHPKGTSGPH